MSQGHLHVLLSFDVRCCSLSRNQAEVDISKYWPTRRVSSGAVNVSTGRLHHSPSRVDKLLVDVQKEHGKVQ